MPDGPVRVGGRVTRTQPPVLWIHDAFATVKATASATVAGAFQELGAGDLVTLEGRLAGGELREATVVQVHHRPGPTPTAEGARLRDRGVAHHLRRRAAIFGTVRRFFEDRGYLEVETPALVPSPGLDLHLDAFEIPEAFPDQRGYLITSPEYQMKRLLSGGLPRLFQLARCFRRGELGERHNPEFTMVEWYRAFGTVEAMMAETEDLLRHVVERHRGTAEDGTAGRRIDWPAPFERWTVASAFERFANQSPAETGALARDDEDQFFRLLVERVEPGLVSLDRPVFLHDYPATMASLARLKPAEPEVCERFELYVGDLELCNGFGELTEPVEQRRRFQRDQRRRKELGKPVYPLDERLLGALEEGMPPAAGNALGLDRLVALCIGTDTIADVQAFPAEWL
ncbi:MAG: EF-P lysine aminoacylase GenX [Deltaproteobacteria bacterium]|nr:EF-P lysine aminoacylase GenX [Deltaproteobacteria bacterium]